MATKKSHIALMLTAGITVLSVVGYGAASSTGSGNAYSKDLSYPSEISTLSEETESLLDSVAAGTDEYVLDTKMRLPGTESAVQTVSTGLSFEQVQEMKLASSLQSTMTDANQTDKYLVSTGRQVTEEEVESDSAEEIAGEESEAKEKTVSEDTEDQDPLQTYVTEHVITDDTKVETSLNVREGAGTEHEVVGRMYPQSAGEILEEKDGWVKIASGHVEGWVSSDYLLTGEDALETITENGYCYGTVTAEALNVRDIPGLDSNVVSSLAQGADCVVASIDEDGWAAVTNEDGTSGYVSAEYLDVAFALKDAMTLEEEQTYLAELAAAEAARQEEEARRQAEEQAQAAAAAAASQTAAYLQSSAASLGTGAISLSAEEMVLMANVVDMEAAYEPYEGKLAVANVILNRYRSGIWGYSIPSIIYAPGQFVSQGDPRLTYWQQIGPTAEGMRAVQEACAGVNNIGGLMYYCSSRSANVSQYSYYIWVGSQCFYQK